MTDPTRGGRLRRGARRPGWVLTTALLILAIGASSALVFTNRAELLKLAVLLALWAAVVAAFVSVIYRRQADSDQAKVRDLKLVYDLQLDREISARREYELAVEAQLRRELAAELRAQSADEVSALRAELAALRANLEYLFDADLSHRHAIETDRSGSRSYGDWMPRADTAGRVSVSRIDAEDAEEVFHGQTHGGDTEVHPIIDVPAEPHPPEAAPVSHVQAGGAHRRSGPEARELLHRTDDRARRTSAPPPPPTTPQMPQGGPPAPPEPLYPWLPPPTPQAQTADPVAPAHGSARASGWLATSAEGESSAPGVPGSDWVQTSGGERFQEGQEGQIGYVGRRRAPEGSTLQSSVPPAPPADPPRDRHSSFPTTPPGVPPTIPPVPPEAPSPARRLDDRADLGDTADVDGGAHTGGQSVAELMARLQATPSGGGGRRRRED